MPLFSPTRTIESPGVEIREFDLSQRVPTAGGTNIYLQGFANQGPTDEVVLVSSIADFEAIYGLPRTAAERYLYHSAKGALNSPATVYVNRLPYGSGSGIGFGSQYGALYYPVTAYNTATNQFSNTLDLSAGVYLVGKPTQIPLNRSDYESIINGSIQWGTTPKATFTGVNDISGAGIVVINNSQTVIDSQYQGYYIGLGDNVDVDNSLTSFSKIKSIYSVSLSGIIGGSSYTDITNTGVLTFSLTSAPNTAVVSVSYIMETQITSWILSTPGYDDFLNVGVFKLRSSFNNDDPQNLTYVVTNKFTGSIDYYRNVTTQSVVNQPAYLGTAAQGNGVTVLVNPYISNFNGVNGKSTYNNLLTNKKVRVLTSALSTQLSTVPGLSATLGTTLTGAQANVAAAITAIGTADALFPLGVYSNEKLTGKDLGDIPSKLTNSLEKVRNRELFDIDIIPECGLGTVYAYTDQTGNNYFDDTDYGVNISTGIQGIQTSTPNTAGNSLVTSYNDVGTVFNSFCASTQQGGRGDVVFIADPLRWIFVQGSDLKTMSQQGAAFSLNITWPLRNQFSIYNTNYAAVYANWLKSTDNNLGKDIWVPSSGFAAGKYATTDAIIGPWGAPAGFNRGIISNVVDTAISPNQKQRDELYKASLNPIINSPGQGIALFGQKTLQKSPSAFDRINVRRMFLYCEKAVYRAMQAFVFENNTESLRRQVVNLLNPFFNRIKNSEGLYDFLVKCDSVNNTGDIIDNNELVVDILIKPVRTAEYILVNFIATRTDANFQEIVGG